MCLLPDEFRQIRTRSAAAGWHASIRTKSGCSSPNSSSDTEKSCPHWPRSAFWANSTGPLTGASTLRCAFAPYTPVMTGACHFSDGSIMSAMRGSLRRSRWHCTRWASLLPIRLVIGGADLTRTTLVMIPDAANGPPTSRHRTRRSFRHTSPLISNLV